MTSPAASELRKQTSGARKGEKGQEETRTLPTAPCRLIRCKFLKTLSSTLLTHSSSLSLCSNSLPLSSPHLAPLLPPPTLGCSVSLWLPCLPPVRPSQDLWVEHRGPSHTMGKGPAYPCLPLRPELSPLLTPPAPRAPSVELFLIPPPARAGLETPSVSS